MFASIFMDAPALLLFGALPMHVWPSCPCRPAPVAFVGGDASWCMCIKCARKLHCKGKAVSVAHRGLLIRASLLYPALAMAAAADMVAAMLTTIAMQVIYAFVCMSTAPVCLSYSI